MARTRIQAYRYSSKVAGVVDLTGIPTWQSYTAPDYVNPTGYGLGLQLINPVNLLTIEAIVTRFRASSITASAKIIGIGIADADVNPLVNVKFLPVNIVQVSGVIDFSKSLSGMLLPNKNNVVNLMFDRATTCKIEVWKNDMLYTVQGVK